MQKYLFQGGHRYAIAADAEPARTSLDLMLDGGEKGCKVLYGVVR